MYLRCISWTRFIFQHWFLSPYIRVGICSLFQLLYSLSHLQSSILIYRIISILLRSSYSIQFFTYLPAIALILVLVHLLFYCCKLLHNFFTVLSMILITLYSSHIYLFCITYTSQKTTQNYNRTVEKWYIFKNTR